jgi:hypothetical protein
MKPLLLALIFLIGTAAQSSDPDLTPPTAPNLSILNVSSTGIINVRFTNKTGSPIRIFTESNSWGAMNWRVLQVKDGRVETFYQSPFQLFTKNAPRFDEISLGAFLDRKINLNGGNWCGLGHCSWWRERGLGGKTISFQKGDQIMVIYDTRMSDESQKYHVFSGVIAASTVVP